MGESRELSPWQQTMPIGIERYRKKEMKIVSIDYVGPEPVISEKELCVIHTRTGKLGTLNDIEKIEQIVPSKSPFVKLYYAFRKKVINPIRIYINKLRNK